MPVSYKRSDDLDKMLAEFASFDHLENVEFPEDQADKQEEKKAD